MLYPDKRPPPDWPSRGEIEMNKVQLKYRQDLISLRDISCKIMSKEKVCKLRSWDMLTISCLVIMLTIEIYRLELLVALELGRVQ